MAGSVSQQELKKQIAAGNIAPLYYFYGENVYLVEETITVLQARLLGAAASEFDCSSFDAEIHDPSEVLNAAQTMPLQVPKRLVVVKRADAFTAAQWEQFHRYITKPSTRCCLIFAAAKLSLKGKLLSLFQEHGVTVLFENPRQETIATVIKAVLAGYGKKVTADALPAIVEMIGTDSQAIHRELEKLALYCADKMMIEKEDAEAVLSGVEQQTVFQLVDAIGHGQTETSLKLLNALIGTGMDPLPILGMIARQLRLLAFTREAVQRGDTVFQIAPAINEFNRKLSKGKGTIPQRQIENFMRQAKRWPLERIGRALEEISLADLRLKSSRIEKQIILEQLIFQL
ncbi:MAG: DNA polymerase III subunit delta [Proteobacteria bacterium]|nr:DNA polymerase III subunit delta [Pseudomonadota bacterium]